MKVTAERLGTFAGPIELSIPKLRKGCRVEPNHKSDEKHLEIMVRPFLICSVDFFIFVIPAVASACKSGYITAN